MGKHVNKKADKSAYRNKKFPVNYQLREARRGLISVRNYWIRRTNKGDPLLDQFMVDALEASQEALRALDKLEDAMGFNEQYREDLNSELVPKLYRYSRPQDISIYSDDY